MNTGTANWRSAGRRILAGIATISFAATASADVAYDWSALAGVRKIGFVNPSFATESRRPVEGSEPGREHAIHLRRLRLTLQKALLHRMRIQKRFILAPQARVEKELHRLHWTSANLFVNGGIVAGKGWPVPDRGRVAQLAKRVGVDAILIGELYEPASISEGAQLHHEVWNANPLNISLRRMRAHVISPRVQAFMVTNAGSTVWKDEQMADHPRTNPRTPRTLLLDWQEATAQVADQVADSLLRLPPPGR